MLPRPIRRLLSTKVAQLTKMEKEVPYTASSQQIPTKNASAESDISHLSHFAAFTSMENYVAVTLIQYNKEKEDPKPLTSLSIT